MKHLYLLLWSLPLLTWAQIPQNYYLNADGKTGDELKAALYNIIKGHTTYPYTSSSTDTWDILKESDRDPDNAENVILLYSALSVNAAQEYNSAKGWTREHVWAKSRGDFGTSQGAGTDCHHLRPENDNINSTRSNLYFDEGGSVVKYNNVATGCYKNSARYTFEPRDAVKGDVARMILYMAVRYEGKNGEPDLELTESIFGDGDKQPFMGVKSTLLKCHAQDAVDDFERNRNEVVYKYQKNRNPFIDHPEFATAIGGIPAGLTNKQAASYGVSLTAGMLNITTNTPIFRVEIRTITGQLLWNATYHGETELSIDAINIPNGIALVVINGEKAVKIIK
ncbi:endonuclease I [Breznakibacter xylanolyticus]|uniref:Endonuclease I n=1 Tax=Breznakibacter xylanolyticus TaxID=990 RepID=A0A2W7NBB2_9BACT|nr:endonuclease [Breznakibacter xylanolyticus]PZX17418.1 endonuclease I [Breznakibacter xylanolyticus]